MKMKILQVTLSKLATIQLILYKLLRLKYYLRLLNLGFRLLYSFKFLKPSSSYRYHYFDKNLIQKGFYILDMGANLGYYTRLFSKWTGRAGKVFAIEPVSIFYDTLTWSTKKYKNISFFNCALGEDEKEVTMVTPGHFGYLRTGLPHIASECCGENKSAYEYSFNVKMKKASSLFANIPKLDFIKCDIEGYEEIVLPEMQNLLSKFKPIIQLETWGEHKSKTESFLLDLGYEIFDVEHDRLKPIQEVNNKKFGDLIFIHKENNLIIDQLRKRQCA